ncbi:MAG: metallophosphoesterase family protein [Methylocystaceae bacterium]
MKLNAEAHAFLRKRCELPEFEHGFSLVFIGDTHWGEECKGKAKPGVVYGHLLDRIKRNQLTYHNILAIIHGGDGTNIGEKSLEQFLTATRKSLHYDLAGKDHIPLFMNVGNHEYINDRNLNHYNSLVGDGLHVEEIWMRPQKTCLLLLNTGGPNRDGHFVDKQHFSEQLQAAGAIIKAHPLYQFVIDMHIPPAFGPHRGKSHALNSEYTEQFTDFLNQYLKRVAAVVTHHRHCFNPSAIPYRYRGQVPVYLTAYAGHCDCPNLNGLKITYSDNKQGGWRTKISLV